MQRPLAFALLCLAQITMGAGSQAQKPDAPRFEDYSSDVWAGKAELLNLRSHRLARSFRTRLRESLKAEGINFAGHYTFATIGCGAGCSIGAIVDARNGRAWFPKALSEWTGIIGDFDRYEDYEQQTRADSRLIRLLGRPNIGRTNEERYGPGGIYYYEWTNNRLRLVKFIQAGSYLKADPPSGLNK
ncbi:MAG: hypothetical protein AABM67_16090 [Acidobacteriota bacterium]